MTARVVVLASGNGSNLQAMLDAIDDGRLQAEIVAVISDRVDAYALERARVVGAAAVELTRLAGETRADYDRRLVDAVRAHSPDWIVLAGWMRLLTMTFLAAYPMRVINLHPALPGEFPGTHAIERALTAHHDEGLTRTGVMVHFVPDEGVDDGPVIAMVEVPILATDTIDTLSTRVHTAEHLLLVDALRATIAASTGGGDGLA